MIGKLIQVGSVVIVSHSEYWVCKKEIEKMSDLINRQCNTPEQTIDTPFSKSVNNRVVENELSYFNDLQEAVLLFEKQNPPVLRSKSGF